MGYLSLFILYLSTVDVVADLLLLTAIPYVEPPKEKSDGDLSGNADAHRIDDLTEQRLTV